MKRVKKHEKRVAINPLLCDNSTGKFTKVVLETPNLTKNTQRKEKDFTIDRGLYEYVKPRYGVKVARKVFKVYDKS